MLSKILAALAKLDREQIKQFMQVITVFISLFGGSAPALAGGSGNLESVNLTDEDNKNVEKITQTLSEDGTQAAFDISKLIAFARLMRSLFGNN